MHPEGISLLMSIEQLLEPLKEEFKIKISCSSETYTNPFLSSRINRKDVMGDFNVAVEERKVLFTWTFNHAYVLFSKDEHGKGS